MKAIKLLLLLLGSLLLFVSPVSADQVYHSQRLELSLTSDGAAAGHPRLIAGQVVNIHANGPVIGAIERYMINGAKPNTNYQVILHISASCGGTLLLLFPSVTLTTNNTGFAEGGNVISASFLAQFSGNTFGVTWTLVSNGIIAYQTACTAVTID